MLDIEATLVADTEQAKRTIEGGTMARRRFQRGSLFKRGKREKVWVARWWEDVINADGTMGRMRRSIVIGTVAEFTTRRLAMRAFSDRLRSLNERKSTATDHAHIKGFRADGLGTRCASDTQVRNTNALQIHAWRSFDSRHSVNGDFLTSRAKRSRLFSQQSFVTGLRGIPSITLNAR